MADEFKLGQGYTKADWDDVSDNPAWSAADFAAARPLAEVCPDLAASLRKPESASTTEAVSIRLDADILAKLRASGPGWQSRVNEVLRRFVDEAA